jgi:hypothetical protein
MQTRAFRNASLRGVKTDRIGAVRIARLPRRIEVERRRATARPHVRAPSIHPEAEPTGGVVPVCSTRARESRNRTRITHRSPNSVVA